MSTIRDEIITMLQDEGWTEPAIKKAFHNHRKIENCALVILNRRKALRESRNDRA